MFTIAAAFMVPGIECFAGYFGNLSCLVIGIIVEIIFDRFQLDAWMMQEFFFLQVIVTASAVLKLVKINNNDYLTSITAVIHFYFGRIYFNANSIGLLKYYCAILVDKKS